MALTTAVLASPLDTAPPRRPGIPMSVALVGIGLFSVSWDRFLAISLYGYQLKVPTLAFLLALLFLAFDSFRLQRWGMRLPLPLRLAVVILLAELPPLIWAVDRVSTIAELSAIVSKALIPAAATYFVAQAYGATERLLTAFIWGGYFAATFGLYQLAAFYAGVPQLIVYDALGGNLGRISAFSYEAGYFGYFIVLVLGAIVARGHLRRESVSLLPIAFLILVLILTNSRAAFLTVPIFVALHLLRPLSRVATSRVVATTAAILATVGVILLTLPGIVDQMVDRARTITDPSEITSNAPRLDTLRIASEVAADHDWGVGAGNFYVHARQYGLLAADESGATSVVANNIWMQALVDGGWVLLIAQVIFTVVVIATCMRRKHMAARSLIIGWIAVMIIGGMLTSYFFDTKLWVVLSLALAASQFRESDVGVWGDRSDTARRMRIP